MTPLSLGLRYFTLVFLAGFCLGTVRELWVVPLVGPVKAELIETPLMWGAIWFAARTVDRRLSTNQVARRWLAGGVALAALLVVEALLVLRMRGLSVTDYLASKQNVAGIVWIVSLTLFAAMPVIQGTWFHALRLPPQPNEKRSRPPMLPADWLPDGFRYPPAWREFAAAGRDSIGPVNEDWCVPTLHSVRYFLRVAHELEPDRRLVPFLRRDGEDGVACFDADSDAPESRVWILHYAIARHLRDTGLDCREWLATVPPEEEPAADDEDEADDASARGRMT